MRNYLLVVSDKDNKANLMVTHSQKLEFHLVAVVCFEVEYIENSGVGGWWSRKKGVSLEGQVKLVQWKSRGRSRWKRKANVKIREGSHEKHIKKTKFPEKEKRYRFLSIYVEKSYDHTLWGKRERNLSKVGLAAKEEQVGRYLVSVNESFSLTLFAVRFVLFPVLKVQPKYMTRHKED